MPVTPENVQPHRVSVGFVRDGFEGIDETREKSSVRSHLGRLGGYFSPLSLVEIIGLRKSRLPGLGIVNVTGAHPGTLSHREGVLRILIVFQLIAPALKIGIGAL